MPDFLPRKDADLLAWADRFGREIDADPEHFGLTAELVAEFEAARDAYAAAYELSRDPDTRTSVNIIRKDDARRELVATTRRVVRIVRATPGVTPGERVALGLPVRTPGRRRRVPAPATAPRVRVEEVRGRTVRLRIQDSHSARRGKPEGVAGAMVYAYAGHTPPDNAAGWRLAKSTTTPLCDVHFDELPSGTQVWLVACWYSPTAQPGPFGKATCAYLGAAGPRLQLSLAAA